MGRLHTTGDDHDDFLRHALLRWYYPDQVFESAARSSHPLSPVAPSSPYAPTIVAPSAFVAGLASARIGTTFNQYAQGSRASLLRERLVEYLDSRSDATLVLVAEAPGYRGTRVSGIPMTSERQLTGGGPAEATATIVHRVLRELGLEERVLLWNVVPTHPGSRHSNRPPTRAEIDAATPFLEELLRGRRVVAVGRVAQGVLGAPAIRHPSHGGARAFWAGLVEFCDRGPLVSGSA